MRARTSVSVLTTALAALAFPRLASTEELKQQGTDTRGLEEVRWLSELPDGLSAALGRQKAGREGIADVKEQFKSAAEGNGPLPLRRFIVAGVSAKSALVAYEQGGSATAATPPSPHAVQ